MLDRRTVVDVRKIREEREKKLLEAPDSRSGSAARAAEEKRKAEEERKEREKKAEDLMRLAMRREDQKRTAFKLNRLHQQQPLEHDSPHITSPRTDRTARQAVDDVEAEEDGGRTQRPEQQAEEKEQMRTAAAAGEITFITSTNDLQSPSAPAKSSTSISTSESSTARSPSNRTPSSSSLPSSTSTAYSKASDENGSGLSAYTVFLQQRVRHMLVSNGIFIPVGSDDLLLVNTSHNATLATQYSQQSLLSSSSCTTHQTDTPPPPPPPPQFHLPSLQLPTHTDFLPSSASIHLASADERSLYELMLFLARVPLLQGCNMDVFFKVASELKQLRYDEYEVIANEGEEAEWVYFVRDGRIDTKLNLERNSVSAATNSSSSSSKPPTPTATVSSHSGGGSGSGNGGNNSSLRRRFYSVNTASLDVSCLSTFDLCGESVLLPGRRHLTSLISMTASTCYSLSAASLLACLPPHTLTSLALYSAYTSSLISLYTALRSRYRSSYHTSVVDFRLFVEGSLRRNLRHANERSRMRKEIERLGGDGGWMKDRHASRQIRHMQMGQRRVGAGAAAATGGGASGGRRKGRGGGGRVCVEEEEQKEQLVGELAVGGGGGGGLVGGGVRRSVTLPPVFLSFTTLNFGDTPVGGSTDSSPMSSVQSRGNAVLPPLLELNANVHPALR